MILKNLHAIYLFVADVKKSSVWYSKVLNIPFMVDEGNFGIIKIGENELCFHQADKLSPVTTGGSVGYWSVENLLVTVDLFVKNGGEIFRGPIKIPENQGICQIKDPFGNVIGLQGKY